MVVIGIDTWREDGERNGDAAVDVGRGGRRFRVGGGRRGRGGGRGGAAEDGVVEVERRERLRELPCRGGVSGGNAVEAESQVDASAQLVEVLVGDAPKTAPAAAVDRLAAQPRLLAVGVRRPRTHLEEPHGGKIAEDRRRIRLLLPLLFLSPPRGRRAEMCAGGGDCCCVSRWEEIGRLPFYSIDVVKQHPVVLITQSYTHCFYCLYRAGPPLILCFSLAVRSPSGIKKEIPQGGIWFPNTRLCDTKFYLHLN